MHGINYQQPDTKVMLNGNMHKVPRPFKALPLRNTIAENIKTLMLCTPALETQEKLSKKTGIGQATLSRTLNAATWPSSKIIEKIAKAFRIEPWQLLVPGFQPRSSAPGAEIPPNERVLLDQIAALRSVLDSGPFTPRS